MLATQTTPSVTRWSAHSFLGCSELLSFHALLVVSHDVLSELEENEFNGGVDQQEGRDWTAFPNARTTWLIYTFDTIKQINTIPYGRWC